MIEIESAAEAGEVFWIRLDTGDVARGDASGGEDGVQAGIGSNVEKVIAGPEVVVHEVKQVVVEPLGAIHDMLCDDAVGVARIDAVAECAEQDGLVIGDGFAMARNKPADGSENGERTVWGIARSIPDLTKDAEVAGEQGG